MSGTQRVNRSGLQVATELDTLVAQRIIPGTGVDSEDFWRGFAALVADLRIRVRSMDSFSL